MSNSKDINIYMDSLGASAKKASRILSQASEEQKNDALLSIAKKIDIGIVIIDNLGSNRIV